MVRFLEDNLRDNKRGQHRSATEAGNIKRVIRLMREEGQVDKAAKALCSLGVAPQDQNTVEALLRA